MGWKGTRMVLKTLSLVVLLASISQAQSFLVINSTRNPVNVAGTFTPPAITTVSFNGVAQPVTCTNCSGGSGSSVSYTTMSIVQNTVLGATVTFNGAQPVTGTFWQATQPVSGNIGITQGTVLGATVTFNGTQNVNAAQSGVFQVEPGTNTFKVSVGNFPASQAVTGTFFPVTQPVSGNIGLSQPTVLGATVTFNGAQPVTGTFWQNTQPVSGTFFQSVQPVGITQTSVLGATVTYNGTQTVNATQSGVFQVEPGTNTFKAAIQNFPASQAVTGTFFQTTQPVSGNVQLIQNTVLGATVTFNGTQNVSAAQSGTWTVQPGNTANTTAWKVDGSAVTQPVSGTVTSNVGTLPTLTKGTQGSTGISTQDLKDAGRTQVNYYAVAAAAGATATETLLTLTKASANSATATGTSFVITSGKTFRISSISVATRGHATATIQTTTFNFRVNTAGACIVTSTPIEFSARSATPATASAWDRYMVTIPDGWEIAGNGTITFCVSANATYVTNAPTWDVMITGYEY
jgi:hypothetical protein